MRLRLVNENTAFDFFKKWKIWVGLSSILIICSIASTLVIGLNFGIDFKGGTTIRAESTSPISVWRTNSVCGLGGVYRNDGSFDLYLVAI
jgi:preprotein translocase subunit SecF